MEKSIMVQRLVFAVYSLALAGLCSCSPVVDEKQEPDTKEAGVSEKEQVESQTFCGKLLNSEEKPLKATRVPWMYMDDSLKNLCRPLNFILPDMPSDIRELPDFPAIEISRFQMFNEFKLDTMYRENVSDSLVRYIYKIGLGACGCEISRSYSGHPGEKQFDGYVITEQIICNAVDAR